MCDGYAPSALTLLLLQYQTRLIETSWILPVEFYLFEMVALYYLIFCPLGPNR
jgi:hypothetical protein